MTNKDAIEWFKTKLAVNMTLGFKGNHNDAAELAIASLEHLEKEPCGYCGGKDKGFKPLTDTMEYSGIEVALSSAGMLRTRHYPSFSYSGNFDAQDVVNIRFCPMCGRGLEREGQ